MHVEMDDIWYLYFIYVFDMYLICILYMYLMIFAKLGCLML